MPKYKLVVEAKNKEEAHEIMKDIILDGNVDLSDIEEEKEKEE